MFGKHAVAVHAITEGLEYWHVCTVQALVSVWHPVPGARSAKVQFRPGSVHVSEVQTFASEPPGSLALHGAFLALSGF